MQLFKLGSVGDEDTALMLTPDFRLLVSTAVADRDLATAYLNAATNVARSLSISTAELSEANVSEAAVLALVKQGCLAMRDATSYWLSFPKTGLLLKHLRAGREHLARMIRNSKFKEVLQRDLLKRKLKVTKLPIRYHISDALGRGSLEAVMTTSGPLLRLAARP